MVGFLYTGLVLGGTAMSYALGMRYLRGPNMSKWDTPIPTTFDADEPSSEAKGVNEYLSREGV